VDKVNIDSESYWLQRIGELQDQVSELKFEKADLALKIHALGNEITKKNFRIHELEQQIIEFQKKEFHVNEY
jgi:peptidoglycan hydrolase CwlO-like protein